MTFGQLNSTLALTALGHWCRLQLHHFLSSLLPCTSFYRQGTPLEAICNKTTVVRGALSNSYSWLISNTHPTMHLFITKGKRDLQIQQAFNFTYRASICSESQEMNYMLLTRWYHTLQWLAKIYLLIPATFLRYNRETDSLFQIFWTSLVLALFGCRLPKSLPN